MNINNIKKEILKRLIKINPEKIVLFGSYAKGNFNKNSDLDIYVVTSDEYIPKSWEEKSKIYHNVANQLRDIMQKYPTDLLVHTKAMHKKFLKINKRFAKEILENGIILWEKN